jgi:hypothetical protein
LGKLCEAGGVGDYIAEGSIELDKENYPTWLKWKKPFKGVWVGPQNIGNHKEQCGKIKVLLNEQR